MTALESVIVQDVATRRLFAENRQLSHTTVHIRLTENVVDGRTHLLLAVPLAC